MFLRILKLTFSINVNTNIIQRLVNIEKPCVPFFNKTKHNQAYKHVNCMRKFLTLQTFMYQRVIDDLIY